MATKKKADDGIKSKASIDSTSIYAASVKKAEDLYDKARAEKLGSAYEQPYKDNVTNKINQSRNYQKRIATSPSTPSLRRGGKLVKKTNKCTSCGTKTKKK